jgi:hypothetical protein
MFVRAGLALVVGLASGCVIDRAMDDAMRPVCGSFMREMTIYSVHPVYGVFGRHCCRVHGEVFAVSADDQAAPSGAQ